jgi:hypothetical protein
MTDSKNLSTLIKNATDLEIQGKSSDAMSLILNEYDSLPEEIQNDLALVALEAAVQHYETTDIIAATKARLKEILEDLEKAHDEALAQA